MCNLDSWRAASWSFHFLYDPASNGLQSCQSFITSSRNVRWWEEKAITPTVLELKCEGVFDSKVIDPVIRSTRSQVWRTKQYLFIMNVLKWSIFTLTYCLSSSTIFVWVPVVSSYFLGSFLCHVELWKYASIHKCLQQKHLGKQID